MGATATGICGGSVVIAGAGIGSGVGRMAGEDEGVVRIGASAGVGADAALEIGLGVLRTATGCSTAAGGSGLGAGISVSVPDFTGGEVPWLRPQDSSKRVVRTTATKNDANRFIIDMRSAPDVAYSRALVHLTASRANPAMKFL